MEPTSAFSHLPVIPPAADASSHTIRVLVVEDDSLARSWYRTLLASMEELAAFEIVGEADTGDAAERLARELRPDLVLLDLGLPDRDGVAVARQIRADVPAARILVLTCAPEDDARVAALVRLGVAGYLAKHAGLAAIVDALRAVAAGQTYLPYGALQHLATFEETPTPQGRQALQMSDRGHELVPGEADCPIPLPWSLEVSDERSSHSPTPTRPFGYHPLIRATLLPTNPDVTAMLPLAFAIARIPLAVVGTPALLQQAAERADLHDFLIVDCSLARPEDEAQARAIVASVALDVHVIHTAQAFVDKLHHRARGDLFWLPAGIGLLQVVPLLCAYRDAALARHALPARRPLTPHQERVWALVAAGQSHTQIAAAMGSRPGTVKSDIERIKRKLNAATTEELKIAFRWRATL